jgi:hypothetical protein
VCSASFLNSALYHHHYRSSHPAQHSQIPAWIAHEDGIHEIGVPVAFEATWKSCKEDNEMLIQEVANLLLCNNQLTKSTEKAVSDFGAYRKANEDTKAQEISNSKDTVVDSNQGTITIYI